jgi:hypothetical protein
VYHKSRERRGEEILWNQGQKERGKNKERLLSKLHLRCQLRERVFYFLWIRLQIEGRFFAVEAEN